jgi:hypothetical protein
MCSTWHASEARARSSETTNEFTERSSPAPRAILSPDTLVTHGARVPCPICSLRLCSLSRHTDPTAPWCRHCTCSLCISKRPPVHAAVALASSATCRAPRSTRRVLNGCSRLLCLCGPWPVPCLQHGWRCVGFDSPFLHDDHASLSHARSEGARDRRDRCWNLTSPRGRGI